jgi:enamidase
MIKTVIKNIGTLISGDFSNPLLEGDTLVIENGQIAQIGYEKDCQTEGAKKVIDAKGSAVAPGLIDSHVHPVFGDFTPRQKTVDFIDSELHGGVTTMISAGEVHLPGRPKDIIGLKALAIVAARSFKNARPSGVKVHAGAPILELGMVEEDFAEMARAGVKLIGEIGLGSVKMGKDAAPMVQWARKYGMTVTIHTGGPSIAGSSAIDADTVLEANPHIVGHINGGHTSMPLKDIEKLVTQTQMALEVVHCGNLKTALHTLTTARETGNLHRIIIGNDAPSGTGVVPLGILRVMSFLSSFESVPPEQVFTMATGNAARIYNLRVGFIKPGYEADLVILDAPTGSVGKDALSALKAGDLPGVSMVLIDGEIKVQKSRNTPPAERMAEIQ